MGRLLQLATGGAVISDAKDVKSFNYYRSVV